MKYGGPDDWPADRVLHIDQEHGTILLHVRGLLCRDCNYDLEAFIRQAEVIHPGGRGVSKPRNDLCFVAYLRRTSAAPRIGRISFAGSRCTMTTAARCTRRGSVGGGSGSRSTASNIG